MVETTSEQFVTKKAYEFPHRLFIKQRTIRKNI